MMQRRTASSVCTKAPGQGYHGGKDIDQVQKEVFKVNWVSYQEEFNSYISYLSPQVK